MHRLRSVQAARAVAPQLPRSAPASARDDVSLGEFRLLPAQHSWGSTSSAAGPQPSTASIGEAAAHPPPAEQRWPGNPSLDTLHSDLSRQLAQQQEELQVLLQQSSEPALVGACQRSSAACAEAGAAAPAACTPQACDAEQGAALPMQKALDQDEPAQRSPFEAVVRSEDFSLMQQAQLQQPSPRQPHRLRAAGSSLAAGSTHAVSMPPPLLEQPPRQPQRQQEAPLMPQPPPKQQQPARPPQPQQQRRRQVQPPPGEPLQLPEAVRQPNQQQQAPLQQDSAVSVQKQVQQLQAKESRKLRDDAAAMQLLRQQLLAQQGALAALHYSMSVVRRCMQPWKAAVAARAAQWQQAGQWQQQRRLKAGMLAFRQRLTIRSVGVLLGVRFALASGGSVVPHCLLWAHTSAPLPAHFLGADFIRTWSGQAAAPSGGGMHAAQMRRQPQHPCFHTCRCLQAEASVLPAGPCPGQAARHHRAGSGCRGRAAAALLGARQHLAPAGQHAACAARLAGAGC